MRSSSQDTHTEANTHTNTNGTNIVPTLYCQNPISDVPIWLILVRDSARCSSTFKFFTGDSSLQCRYYRTWYTAVYCPNKTRNKTCVRERCFYGGITQMEYPIMYCTACSISDFVYGHSTAKHFAILMIYSI